MPIARKSGWDLAWFGVAMTMNRAIGQFTPPMAVNLMVACKIAGISIESTVPRVIWIVAAMYAAMVAVLLVPSLAPWAPHALGYE